LAKLVVTFRDVGDVIKGTAGLWAKGSLRGKRSDPWRQANVLTKSGAVLV
jgi:hypothetical protein